MFGGTTIRNRGRAAVIQAAQPRERRTYIIGDVHGYRRVLERLLEKISPTAADRVGFVGDLIEYGPDSCAVIDIVRNLSREVGEAFSTMGNHERPYARAHFADLLTTAGIETKGYSKDHPDFVRLLRELGPERLQWLTTLPVYHRFGHFPWGSYLVVHGGIAPTLTPADLPTENREKTAVSLSNNDPLITLLYMRYYDPLTLERLSRERQKTELSDLKIPPEKRPVFWAETYDGRFGTAIFGHHKHHRVTRYPHAIAIDTGCGKNGSLTALEISPQGHLLRAHSVDQKSLDYRTHQPEFAHASSREDSSNREISPDLPF